MMIKAGPCTATVAFAAQEVPPRIATSTDSWGVSLQANDTAPGLGLVSHTATDLGNLWLVSSLVKMISAVNANHVSTPEEDLDAPFQATMESSAPETHSPQA
mmetsp:Transcript_139071/g.277286  ORF Transcript_139071/g.277286 Transcript_139071/m.277286 type:complete len:102 (-) Transcript_139071:370-675(-)